MEFYKELPQKYNNIFTAKINENKIEVRCISLKIKKLYKSLKHFFRFYFTKHFMDRKKVNIFLDEKVKIKKQLILVYSLLHNEIIKENILKKNIKLVILIKEDAIKFKIGDDHAFLIHKFHNGRFNKDMFYFLSDYSTPELNRNQEDCNNLFYNTVNKLIENEKIYTNLRLPSYYFNENDVDLFFTALNKFISIAKTQNLECLCMNLNYHLKDTTTNCIEFNNFNNIAMCLLQSIFFLLSELPKSFVIINLTIANVDECFPLNETFQKIAMNVPTMFKNKFIINIRNLSYINHPHLLEEPSNILNNPLGNIFIKGKSIFVNKIFCNLEDFSDVYIFFFVIQKKFPLLKKKYIKLLLGRFLVKLSFHNFDKLQNFFDPNIKCKNSSSHSCINNIENVPQSGRIVFEHGESIDETKLLLFGKNFNPLEK